MRCIRAALILASCLPVLLPAQTTPPDNEPTVTIRSNPRLVLLNVIATDPAGNPVSGLKKEDFSILEDGKKQGIRAFEEHHADAAEASTPLAEMNLGENVHTNFVQTPKDRVTNILLFDMLNMSSSDLVIAKAELLKTIQKLPESQRFALFVMGSQLHMVQGFTWDRNAMIASAGKISTQSSPGYVDQKSISADLAALKETAIVKTPTAYRALVTTLVTEQDIKLQTRSISTFEVLSQLARTLVAVPGRKNLIWITSAFAFDAARGDMDRFHAISSQMGASQISIYPIDARGVMTGQADATTRDSELFGAGASANYLDGLSEEMRSSYETMFDLAAQTGGRAFINQNTFLPAIERVVDTSLNFYVLAYRPSNEKWNGDYRKIQLKSSKQGLRLQYRTGYYAVADPLALPRAADRDRAMQVAMQSSAPPSTTLIIKTRVVPPSDGAKPVVLDYLADVSDLALVPEQRPSEKKRMEVQFVVSSFDQGGHLVDSHSWLVRLALTDADVKAMLKTGLQLHEDYNLKPGSYQLRLGVLDRNSGKIGTVDVPVRVPQITAAAQNNNR